ncbi:MAG: aldolase/citrate lyase family protein [Terricaulis sp.]
MTFALKTKMRAGELVIGSWLQFGYPQIAEMMAKAGFDYLVIDMEHGAMGTAGMLNLIQVVQLAGIAPIVRVPANAAHFIKTALDAGAEGIIIPDVRSPEEARKAASAMFYPPRGTRGVGLSRAQGFGMDFDGYRDERGPQAVLIVQIEHHDAVRQAHDILAVEGVEGFLIGPYDLSGSLGKPGAFDDPEVKGQLDKVEAVIAASAKPGGYHIVQSDRDALERRIKAGCRLMAYGTDMVLFGEKLRDQGAVLRDMRELKP